MTRMIRAMCLVILASAIPLHSHALPRHYLYVDIQIPYPNTMAAITDINDSGQVAGWYAGSGYHSFVWNRHAGLTDLESLGDAVSFTHRINNSGMVAGLSATPAGVNHPYIWRPGSGMADLDIPNLVSGEAYGINDAGQVVGMMTPTNGDVRPFIWEAGKGATLLGTTSGEARAVNSGGQVAGSHYCDRGVGAFIWSADEGMTELPSGDVYRGVAYDINDSGWVIGQVMTWNYLTHPVLWRGTSMADIGTLGGLHGCANGINNSGWVVGSSRTSDNKTAAFIWEDGVGMVNLNSMVTNLPSGIRLTDATAINNHGWVTGAAAGPAGEKHLYMLIPSAPEPSGLLALGTGLLLLGRSKFRVQGSKLKVQSCLPSKILLNHRRQEP